MADTGATAPPLVSGLNCVYLYVRDVRRSLAFYRDVLGLPLETDDRNPHWAEATLPGGVRFALHTTTSTPQRGTVNIDFEVADIDAAAARLRAAGLAVGEIEREPWGSVFSVEDPDGYRIDIFQPPKR